MESKEKQDYFDTSHLLSGLRQRAVKAAAATVTARIANYAVQMIGTLVLARLLAPSDFGLLAMVMVIAAILVEFGLLRLTEATIQRDDITHQQVSMLFWLNVFLCFGVCLLLLLSAPWFSWFYNEPRLTFVTMAIAPAFLLTGLSCQHLALLQRRMEFQKFAANEISANVISVGVGITLALQGWGIWALVVKQLTASASLALGAWALCSWRPGLPSRNSNIGPMVRFGLNSFGNYSMNYLCRSLDKALIGWSCGPQSLGYYDRAYHLFVMPINQLTYPLTNVAVATLSRLRTDPPKFHRYYLDALSLLAFVGMPLSGCLFLVGKDLVLLLLGSQWEATGRVFMLLSPGIGIMLVYGTHGWLHLSLGRADLWFRWGVFAFFVTALCFGVGIQFGTLGVAVGYASSFYLLLFPGLWYAARGINLGLLPILNVLWRYYLAAAVATFICWHIANSFDYSYAILKNMSVFVRMPTVILIFAVYYFIFLIGLYRSLEPITKFISISRELFRPKPSPT